MKKNGFISHVYSGELNYWKSKCNSLWPGRRMIENKNKMADKRAVKFEFSSSSSSSDCCATVMFTEKWIEYKIFWLLSFKIWCNWYHIDRLAAICLLCHTIEFRYFAQNDNWNQNPQKVFTKSTTRIKENIDKIKEEKQFTTMDNWLTIFIIELIFRPYLFIE